jgi:hypothetical protein
VKFLQRRREDDDDVGRFVDLEADVDYDDDDGDGDDDDDGQDGAYRRDLTGTC